MDRVTDTSRLDAEIHELEGKLSAAKALKTLKEYNEEWRAEISNNASESDKEGYLRYIAYANKLVTDEGAPPNFKALAYTLLAGHCIFFGDDDEQCRRSEIQRLSDAAAVEMKRAEASPCNDLDSYTAMLHHVQSLLEKIQNALQEYENEGMTTSQQEQNTMGEANSAEPETTV